MTQKRTVKRAVDVVLATIGLILTAPLMGLIGVAIRLDGNAQVIFRQKRLGLGGNPFILYKFRKFPDVDSEIGPGLTMANDVRMTRLGEFLERSKLDELPQLWNILRGDMSFVGPRPESVRYQDLFTGEFRKLLDYLPGIFGPSQISHRNESQMYPPDRDPEEFYRTILFPQKARADLEYCGRANVWRDFSWMIRGMWTVFYGAVNWGRVLDLHGRIVFLDLVAIEVAWILANLVRFGELPDSRNLDVFISGCWLMPLVVGPLMMVGGCYRHPVRLFSLVDALRLLLVTAIAWGLAYMILLGFLHRYGSVMLAPLGLLLVLPMMIAPRLWWREKWLRTFSREEKTELKKLIVYGAGRRGSALISLLQHGFPKAEVVGFLDDDEAVMGGRVIRGYRVLGSERDLNTILALKGFEQLWLTFIPEDHKYHRLRDWCTRNGVELIVLPTTPPFSSLIYAEQGELSANKNAADNRESRAENVNESETNVARSGEG